MRDLYSLINEKNSLPKGKVYQKTIKGHLYYYHQYSINGEKFTKKIKDDEVDSLIKDINRRIEIEKEIKDILSATNRNISLSKNAKELTGYVMSYDDVVAEFDHGNLAFIDEVRCPLMIKRTHRLEPFLKSRAIDSGRTNSRLLKKVLNIHEDEDELVSLCSYAASISDSYWFKPKHSKLNYKDVSFNSDIFFDVSLKGLINIYPNKIVLTPELTTNGSFEKGWKNINGEWWLYKIGTQEEKFSELFYSTLFEILGLKTAHYEIDEGYIRSKNFAINYNFEPMSSIADNNEDYSYIFNSLKEYDLEIAKEYLRLCFFDVVLNNVDRHNENVGLLRDKETGKVISLSPNYDDNLSLISRDKSLPLDINEGFIKQFVKVIRSNKDVKDALKDTDIPLLNKDILDKCLSMIPIESGVDNNRLIEYILIRYNYLIKEINK